LGGNFSPNSPAGNQLISRASITLLRTRVDRPEILQKIITLCFNSIFPQAHWVLWGFLSPKSPTYLAVRSFPNRLARFEDGTQHSAAPRRSGPHWAFRSTIYLRISKGSFPKSISLGGRAVGWVEAEINAWLNRQIGHSLQAAREERAAR